MYAVLQWQLSLNDTTLHARTTHASLCKSVKKKIGKVRRRKKGEREKDGSSSCTCVCGGGRGRR